LSFAAGGRALLVAIGARAGQGTIAVGELAMIGISEGTRRTLRTFERHIPLNASLSPDGQEVAFDFEPTPGSGRRDIAVISLGNSSERLLGGAPGLHKVLLGWLPDEHVLFTANQDGRTDAWVMKVAATRGQPAAVIVRRDVGQLEPLGVTSDGRVFVQKSTSVGEIYVAELDPVSGKARQSATPLQGAQPGLRRSEPAWSPDGLRIAHVQLTTGTAAKVVVHTIATRESRVYDVPVRNMDWMLWARDGKSVYFDGTDTRDNVQRMSRLDLDNGGVEAASDPRRLIIGFSPDDRYVFEVGAGRGLTRRDRTTGTTDVLGGGAPAVALSPDAEWIAYLQTGPARQRTLAVRPATGGPERILLERFAPGYPRLTWTPDSRHIIFNVQQEGLHRVSLQGGAKESLNVGRGLGWITEKSMNVNGRHLAFAVTGTDREVWMWADVVPRTRR
jgi:Tol biopolymer transport system component